MMGKIIDILIANNAKESLFQIEEAQIIKNKGIVGDRYFNEVGSFSQKLKEKNDFHVTLIEQEEIDSFNRLTNLNYNNKLFRRNLVTKGIKLNYLVGKKFKINGVVLVGMRLCEPCQMLSEELGEEFLNKMIHKSGLRAKVIESGDIKVGDTIHEFRTT